MKAKYIISAIAAVALVSASCDPDLLDIAQKGVQSEQNSYITDSDCEQALAAVYNRTKNVMSGRSGVGQYENSFMMKNLLGDDIRTGSSRTDQASIQEIWELHLTPTNKWFRILYSEYYEAIYLANLVIENFDASESSTKARDIDEAKGLRDLCYYDLVTLWGRVPLVTSVLKSNEEFQVANSEIADIWAFLESDLKEIISGGHLTQRNGKTDTDGSIRFTIDAARTLLGKVYMYEGKYSEAKPVLQAVINSDNFELISDVSKLYHTSANGCAEYVFEFSRHYDLSNQYLQDGWQGILWNWPFAYGFNIGSDAYNFFAFNPQGYSFCQVPKELYDAFVAEEGENGKRVSAWIVPLEKLPEIGIGVSAQRSMYNCEGYLRLKWLASQEDENVTYWHGNLANTPHFKYDDVLLLAAEACLQTSDMTNAIKYVNEVRKRADLSPISSLTMDQLKKERRLELAMDGVRFQDLKRWGDAPTVLANKAKSLPTMLMTPDASNDPNDMTYHTWKYSYEITWTANERSDAGWTTGRDDYLPFPQEEIDVNKNIQQNPGY